MQSQMDIIKNVEHKKIGGQKSGAGPLAGNTVSPLIIQARNLVVEYERSREKTKLVALQDFSLDVLPGEFITIVGPSGCGKSTFLNVVAGLYKQKSGEICVNNKPVNGPGLDRAMVFQDYGLFPWRTVQKNVEFRLEMQRKTFGYGSGPVDECIQLVGLEGFEHAYPPQTFWWHVPAGRLTARALAVEPNILLMDEPFAAVDLITRELMQDELARVIAATGKTVIFVTHSVDEAIILGDKVVLLTGRPARVKRIIPVNLPSHGLKRGLRSSPEY